MVQSNFAIRKRSGFAKILCVALGVVACCYMAPAFADTATGGIGGIAANIAGSFTGIGKMLVGMSYLCGIGFAMGGIFKFKQHKDNPTQIPVGTPIALMIIGVALVFLPSFFEPAGETIFGTGAKAGGFTGGGALTGMPTAGSGS